MEVVDFLAEGGEVASEGASIARGIPATSVEGRDTGPWTARDEVTRGDVNTPIRSYN